MLEGERNRRTGEIDVMSGRAASLSRKPPPPLVETVDQRRSPDFDPAAHLHIIQSITLPQAVQQQILKMILRGQFKGGDKLNEAELAAALGVSRGPVREAFRGLEETGLVRATKNRGVFVREISVPEARDLYDMRECLEAYAGRLLAPKITSAELKELRSLVRDMEPSFAQHDVEEYYPRNTRFHDRIIEMAGSPKLISVYRNLVNEIQLISRRGIARGGGRLASNGEHHEIVRALGARDPERAAAVMSAHVRGRRDQFLSQAAS